MWADAPEGTHSSSELSVDFTRPRGELLTPGKHRWGGDRLSLPGGSCASKTTGKPTEQEGSGSLRGRNPPPTLVKICPSEGEVKCFHESLQTPRRRVTVVHHPVQVAQIYVEVDT